MDKQQYSTIGNWIGIEKQKSEILIPKENEQIVDSDRYRKEEPLNVEKS